MGLNFKAALVESLLAITGFGVLGTILFWLVAGRYWGKPKFHPYQLGLWWGAWVSAASVMALGRNYYKGFAEVFFSMLLVVPIFFGIGFIAGFVFRKLKPIAGDTSKDYYRIIGVLDDAEDIVIEAAYRALAQRYHLDKWQGDPEEAAKRMAEINETYDVLSNPSKRTEYDTYRSNKLFVENLSRRSGVPKWVFGLFGTMLVIGLVAAVVIPTIANKKNYMPTENLFFGSAEIQQNLLSINNIMLGDKLTDFLFKNEGFKEHKNNNEHGQIEYKSNDMTVYIKTNKVDQINYFCRKNKLVETTSLESIICGSSEDDILKYYGKRIQVICIANLDSNGSIRAYEVLARGVRFILQHNKVTQITLTSNKSSWAQVNPKDWINC